MGLRHWIFRTTGIRLKKIDIVIEKDTDIDASCVVQDGVFIGHKTCIREDCIIHTGSKIGRYCSISTGVMVGPDSHPMDWLSTHSFQYQEQDHVQYHTRKKSGAIIGNDVWIGMRAIVQEGVVVNDGAIIGSSAVVTKEVPPYAIVAGVPARVIRYRFDEATIETLLALKWWEIECSELLAHQIRYDDIHLAIDQIMQIKQKLGM